MSAWLNLVKYFLIKDIKAKYAGSGLGMVWSFLLPLLQIVIYWGVFAGIMKARPYGDANVPYIYFLLSAFFFWLAFSEGLARASTVILENAEIVKKVSFSNMVLPVAVTLSAYVNHMIGFLLFLVVYAATSGLHPTLPLVVPVLLLQIIFSLGLGLTAAALLPYVRDLAQLIGYLMQALFFLSPIIYSMEAVPERYRLLFYLNPMTYFASSYHRIILTGETPPLSSVAVICALAAGSIAVGTATFRKLNEGFADVL